MAKIKRTKNGNIQITISEDQAAAVRDIVGYTNNKHRTHACHFFKRDWTMEQDDALTAVYNLIDDFKG